MPVLPGYMRYEGKMPALSGHVNMYGKIWRKLYAML